MTKKTRKRRKGRKWNKSLLIPICLLGISVLLMAASIYMEGFANWYTEHIYPVVSGAMGRLFGMIPVSVAEIGLYLLVLILVFGLIYIVLSVFHRAWTRQRSKKTAKVLLWIVSLLLFLYVVNCGINYRSASFSEKSGIQTRKYTVEELAEVCRILTEKVQKTEPDIARDEDGRMIFETSEKKNAVRAMQHLGETYPDFEGYYPEPKGLLFPDFLSWQGLTGVYSPFTVEANYNNAITEYSIPFTMCHELSHLKGFMQEQEANFIAWLACDSSDIPEFQYSAALSGWVYATNMLWDYDPDTYEQLYAALPDGAKADLQAGNEFWDRYEGKIQEVSNKINDAYLKTNGQKDGVESYDKMVDMLVAYLIG